MTTQASSTWFKLEYKCYHQLNDIDDEADNLGINPGPPLSHIDPGTIVRNSDLLLLNDLVVRFEDGKLVNGHRQHHQEVVDV